MVKSAAPSTKPAQRFSRSRITNGKEVLPGIDGRSAAARRFRDIASAIATDLGGPDRLSEVRGQLIRRFAALAMLAEKLEAELAAGQSINLVEHCAISSTLVRLSNRIGLNRTAREIVPSLAQYLEAKQAEPA